VWWVWADTSRQIPTKTLRSPTASGCSPLIDSKKPTTAIESCDKDDCRLQNAARKQQAENLLRSTRQKSGLSAAGSTDKNQCSCAFITWANAYFMQAYALQDLRAPEAKANINLH